MKKPKGKKSSKQTVESERGMQAMPSPKTTQSAATFGPLTAEQYRFAAHMAAFEHCDPKKAEQFELLAQAAEERERTASKASPVMKAPGG